MCASMLSHFRLPKMNLVQKMISGILYAGGLSKTARLYVNTLFLLDREILSRLGMVPAS